MRKRTEVEPQGERKGIRSSRLRMETGLERNQNVTGTENELEWKERSQLELSRKRRRRVP
jgi:hypothetical protein